MIYWSRKRVLYNVLRIIDISKCILIRFSFFKKVSFLLICRKEKHSLGFCRANKCNCLLPSSLCVVGLIVGLWGNILYQVLSKYSGILHDMEGRVVMLHTKEELTCNSNPDAVIWEFWTWQQCCEGRIISVVVKQLAFKYYLNI